MAIHSVNPTTGAIIATYDEMELVELGGLLERGHEAFVSWRHSGAEERASRLKAAATCLREGSDRFAELMAAEMGKPLREGRSEIAKCATGCDYYAENAAGFLREERVPTEASNSFVTFQPLGVILAVMPWNFPFWQVFRFAAPALAAGNAVLLKHASNVPGCALAIEAIFEQAGFPADLVRTALVGNDQVASLIEHPRIAAVTLTGSTRAGSAVASKAGAMLKKTVLELGGSDAYIILEDADLEQAAAACVASRLINSGQSCIAAKRFVVPDAIRERFERRLVEAMATKRMGDPLDESSDIGPLARVDLRDELHRQVRASIEKGAKCLLGGTVPDRRGAFYPPTVLTAVRKGMPAYDEELFGPVAAVIPVSTEDEAVRIANDSAFGLGAAVFTSNPARGTEIAAKRLEAGSCFVNTFVRSDPRLPFGGIKQSGYGRELGEYGIKEFVNIKTVYVQ